MGSCLVDSTYVEVVWVEAPIGENVRKFLGVEELVSYSDIIGVNQYTNGRFPSKGGSVSS